MVIDVLDFDDNRAWGPLLTAALGDLISESVEARLMDAAPECIEDALDVLFSCTDCQEIIEVTLDWICSTTLVGYHGSRLTDSEVASIRARGLVPLDAQARRARLRRALSSHPRWGEAADQLEATLRENAEGREGQVHLALSRFGLINSFNQYLTYGSDFDRQVAQALLGTDGKKLLQRDGQARVVRVAVPGEDALNAAHPHFTVERCLTQGKVPNLVNEFLQAWSYGLAHPAFDCRTRKEGCSMMFRSTVPSGWIVDVDTLAI